VNVARIERETGRVVNIEVVDEEWLAANAKDEQYEFVEYAPEDRVQPGVLRDVGKRAFVERDAAIALPVFPVDDAEFLNVDDGLL
jgi:hypothetical protein